jgi:hypothetical protein
MRTTGLWQPAWIEAAGTSTISELRITPDIDRSEVRGEARIGRAVIETGVAPKPMRLRMVARLDGNPQAVGRLWPRRSRRRRAPVQRLWSPQVQHSTTFPDLSSPAPRSIA